MQDFIKIQDKNLFLLNTELLGLNEAQLWVGKSEGPADNNDERVEKERAEAKTKGEIFGIEAVNLKESEKYPSWFEVDTSSWPAGVYRFNIHAKAGVKAPNGTALREMRDGQYSWPVFSDEYLLNLPDEIKDFLYLEKNKMGFCIRIEITLEREIKPAGDGREWISHWPEIKNEVEEVINKKVESYKK